MASAKKRNGKRTKSNGLTPQQEKFCQHFALSQNAAAAYAHAYPASKKSTAQYRSEKSSKLRTEDKIKARIATLTSKVLEIANKKFEVTVEKVLQEMAAMAFANSDDYFTWGTHERPVFNRKTGEPVIDLETGAQAIEHVPYVRIKPSAELSRVQKSAIIAAEETISKTGDRVISVKMGPKLQALKHLGDYLKMFAPDRPNSLVSVTVNNGQVPAEPNDITMIEDKREALRAFQMMRDAAVVIDASPQAAQSSSEA